MGKKGGAPEHTTTTQSPWAGTIPGWNQTFQGVFGTPGQPIYGAPTGGGKGGYGGGFDGIDYGGGGFGAKRPITGHTEATPGLLQEQLGSINPYLQQGWNMTAAGVGDPSSQQLLTGSKDYINRILSGEMLDPTKNLELAMNWRRGLEDIQPAWDTGAIQAGRYGSGAWAAGQGRQLADLQGSLYGTGLQQMTQAAGMAPGAYKSQFLPSQIMTALGQAQEDRPWDLYSRGAQLLSGPSGGSQTTPYFKPNPMTGILGGAAAGSAFGPMGAAIGGGLGLLGGK